MTKQGRGCNAHNHTMNQTKQRGGKRIGAGRKPGVKKARNKIARSITLQNYENIH